MRLRHAGFYHRAGEVCGPVPAERLMELLTVGLLQPRQAVWQNGGHSLRLVHAAAAASGATGAGSQPPGSQPASARWRCGQSSITPAGLTEIR